MAAGAIIQRRLRELGRPVEWAYEITFSALGGGLVGARGYYVLTHTGELADDPFGTLFGGSRTREPRDGAHRILRAG